MKALNDAGYDTALFGKYMNGRGSFLSIASGWDRWFELPGSTTHSSDGYNVNDQGTNVHYPAIKNDSQLAYEKALAWINSRTPASRPSFIQYSPTNPHLPYTPTAAHAHDYDNEPPRSVPSLHEANMRDKLAKMRKSMGSVATMENAEEGMREELEDTDDFIADLIAAAELLRATPTCSSSSPRTTASRPVSTGSYKRAGLTRSPWKYRSSCERRASLPSSLPSSSPAWTSLGPS